MRQQVRIRRILAAVLAAAVLCALPLAAAGAEEDETAASGDMTGECSFIAANRRHSLESVADDSERTKMALAANEWFSLQWGNMHQAEGLYLLWESAPDEYIIEQRDHSGATISTSVYTQGLPQAYIRLEEGCGMVLLLARSKGTLRQLCLCAADAPLPEHVHAWEPAPEKADLMLVVGHPGDEFEIFPGILETYAIERGLNCVLVYLTHPGDRTLNRALDALWAAGLRNLPVIGEYKESVGIPLTALEGYPASDEYATSFIAEQIRRYQPLVVVSHAEGGEDGDDVRDEAYRATRQAAALANSESIFPDSAAAYGLWHVSKLYLHDYAERQMQFNGVTYGLVSSTVGEDSGQADLFENIPESAYAGYVPPEPTPTPVPEPTETPAPTPSPSPSPTPSEVPEIVQVRRVSVYAWLGLGLLLVVILVLVAILAVRVTREWRRTGVPRPRRRKPPEGEDRHE
ncbi:MAG: hypothetical protein Q4C13_07325 [Clostridia bacterium]|nr:hypothetical protein [Clostridia bacterium]